MDSWGLTTVAIHPRKDTPQPARGTVNLWQTAALYLFLSIITLLLASMAWHIYRFGLFAILPTENLAFTSTRSNSIFSV